MPKHQGFTLVEVAVLIAIIAILAGVGTLSFRNQAETQDAALANSVLANLQAALGQMAMRLENTPDAVFNAQRGALAAFVNNRLTPQTPLVDNGATITLTFTASGRNVVYNVNAQGDIVIQAENFGNFNVGGDGRLQN